MIPNPYEPSLVEDGVRSARIAEVVLVFCLLLFVIVAGCLLLVFVMEVTHRGWQLLPEMWPIYVLQFLTSVVGIRNAWSGPRALMFGHDLPRPWRRVLRAMALLLLIVAIQCVNMAIFHTLTN